jgi:hypothetical protein
MLIRECVEAVVMDAVLEGVDVSVQTATYPGTVHTGPAHSVTIVEPANKKGWMVRVERRDGGVSLLNPSFCVAVWSGTIGVSD